MAAKKPDKSLVISARNKALIKAIATGNTEGLALEDIKDLLVDMGMDVKLVAAGVATERYSRIEKRRSWLTAKSVSKEEKALIKALPDKLGTAPTILSQDEAREFSQTEVDALVAEEVARRQTEDILKGRYDAIRATALNLVTFRDKDSDPFACGIISSPAIGYKLIVSKQERGGNVNYTALEGVVDSKVWNSITEEITTREVNEDKLANALSKGVITMEQFASIIPEKTTSRVLCVDPIKAGDDI